MMQKFSMFSFRYHINFIIISPYYFIGIFPLRFLSDLQLGMPDDFFFCFYHIPIFLLSFALSLSLSSFSIAKHTHSAFYNHFHASIYTHIFDLSIFMYLGFFLQCLMLQSIFSNLFPFLSCCSTFLTHHVNTPILHFCKISFYSSPTIPNFAFHLDESPRLDPKGLKEAIEWAMLKSLWRGEGLLLPWVRSPATHKDFSV